MIKPQRFNRTIGVDRTHYRKVKNKFGAITYAPYNNAPAR